MPAWAAPILVWEVIVITAVLNASLGISGGPTLALGRSLPMQSYVFASEELTEAGGSHPSRTVDLLPDGGTVVLLAIVSQDPKGKPAPVAAELRAGSKKVLLEVTGSLLIANEDALASMVETGPRTVVVTNEGTAPIKVDVIAGHVSA